MSADEIPDVEYAAKRWTTLHPWLSPLHGGRVFFTLPPGDVTWPAITVGLLSDTPDLGPAVTTSRIGWQVWGETKKQAADLRRVLVAALRAAPGTFLQPDVWCHDVTGIFSMNAPEDESKLRRCIVDADVLARVHSLV